MKRLGQWNSSLFGRKTKLCSQLKAQPRIPKGLSRGKSLLSEKKSASIEGGSVVDCCINISYGKYVTNKDPTMVKAVEEPSAFTNSDVCDSLMQWTEARSLWRNAIPMNLGKARDIVYDSSRSQVGDNSHEKGGTQKFHVVQS